MLSARLRRQKNARIPGGSPRFSDGNVTNLGRKYHDFEWGQPGPGRGHPIFRRKRHGFGRQYTDFRAEASRIPGKSVPDPGKHAQDRSRVSLPQSFPGHPGVRGLRSADTTELCPKTITEAQPAGLCKKQHPPLAKRKQLCYHKEERRWKYHDEKGDFHRQRD